MEYSARWAETARRWDEVALRVRRAAAAAADELSTDLAVRSYEELQVLGGELRQALSELAHGVPRAPEPLAAYQACTVAVDSARELLAVSDDRAGLAALDIEPDVADVVVLLARLRVAQRLGGVQVRATAGSVGVTPGYVSELRRVKKGLPSPDVAARLDQWVAPPSGEASLAEIVRDAKAERTALTEQRKNRRGGVLISGLRIPADLRGRDRLNAIADALRVNESLQRTVELIISLPDRERRAIGRLAEELARD